MQRDPGVAVVHHFEHGMRQEIENAGFQVKVARVAARADERVVGFQANHSRRIEQGGDLVLRPLRPDHGEARPIPLVTFFLQVNVAGVEIVIEIRQAEGDTLQLAIRKDRPVTVLHGGRVDGLQHFVDPVLAPHGLGHGLETESGIHDVRVRVVDAARQPVLQMLRPERAVHIGVMPDEVERDWVHGEQGCAGGSVRRY
jgi:hypothetical protein